jgi:two-component system sensor histidine kinase RegB
VISIGERADRGTGAQLARLRSEKLASLATLAAGAAHELATPLSTIAVVAKELERSLAQRAGDAEAAADARMIREEVERCREVLRADGQRRRREPRRGLSRACMPAS